MFLLLKKIITNPPYIDLRTNFVAHKQRTLVRYNTIYIHINHKRFSRVSIRVCSSLFACNWRYVSMRRVQSNRILDAIAVGRNRTSSKNPRRRELNLPDDLRKARISKFVQMIATRVNTRFRDNRGDRRNDI